MSGPSEENEQSDTSPSQTRTNGNADTSQVKKKKKDQQEIVDKLIDHTKLRQLVALDLSKKGLRKIPDSLLELNHVEYLYLEGNEMTCLPENFFDCLPNLKWLDLRNNCLKSVPSAYIGRHQHLRNLLLEGNQLRTLPLELGLVLTINGLNLSGNDFEFPPPEVIERGTQTVLAFLREVLKAKSIGKIPPAEASQTASQEYDFDQIEPVPRLPRVEDLKLYDSDEYSSEDEWTNSARRYRRQPSQLSQPSASSSQPSAHVLSSALSRTNSEGSDLVGPVPQSASLQRRTSYNERKQSKIEKLRRAGALGMVDKETSLTRQLKSQGKKSNSTVSKTSMYSDMVPTDTTIQQTYIEERRLARLRELNEKQDMILQRRRDQESLKEWRDDGKKKQIDKHREKLVKGRLDYEEPAKLAPFAVDKGHMRIPTNEERIAEEVRKKHEKIRRAVSPGSQQKMEEARAERDREIQEKLRLHTHQMQERRRQPKGTPQQEMAAAKQELQIAEQLQREVERRRKELEYRFTAFTGDGL